MLFTNEVHFSCYGQTKTITFTLGCVTARYGGIEFQYRFSANAWCGVIDGFFIAPLVAEGSLQTQHTQRFCNTCWQSWECALLCARSRTYSQREEASPRTRAHETHTSVTKYLNDVLAVALRRSGHRNDPKSNTLRCVGEY